MEHSFDSLHRFAPDARIVVTVPADSLEYARELFKESKAEVIVGGSSRQASAYAAMQHLEERQPRHVILHDAARPFLSHQILHDTVEALKRHKAVDVAIKTSDTIIVECDGFVQSIPERNHLYRGQTPQGFCYRTLMLSYKKLGPDRLAEYTDDCGVFLACHPTEKVRIVQGNSENIKITDEIDLVRSGLEEVMCNAYCEIRDLYRRRRNIDTLRTAAYSLAIDKVARAYFQLGIFP